MSDDYYYFLPRSEAEVRRRAKVDDWVRSGRSYSHIRDLRDTVRLEIG
jgi:hypothetical protein